MTATTSALDYLPHAEAERIAGKRLDRRRRYFMWEIAEAPELCVTGKTTEPCTGCSDDRDYVIPTIGAGCSECGYTGKRVWRFPVPIAWLDEERRRAGAPS